MQVILNDRKIAMNIRVVNCKVGPLSKYIFTFRNSKTKTKKEEGM